MCYTLYSCCYKITIFYYLHLFTGYVEEIFQVFLQASKKDLKQAAKILKDMSPEAMNTMLPKQSKSAAIKKRAERAKMVVKNVPPTTSGNFLKLNVTRVFKNAFNTSTILFKIVADVTHVQVAQKTKSAPKCKACRQPMKGHKYVKDCPKNANRT